MKPKIYFMFFFSILLLWPLSGPVFAQTSGQDSFDQSALLMLRSKNAMQGQDANELRQLAGYYEDYYTNMSVDLQVSGQDPDGKLYNSIVEERDKKVDKLLEQAEKLDAARQQKRRRNPNTAVRKVARFFGGIIKGGGRALGFGVSKTMEGISRGTQIVIDEVGPKVIEGVLRHAKTVILSGGTLEGSALRTLVRELFQKHAENVLKARLLPKVARAAERVLGPQAVQAIAVFTGEGENLQAGTTAPTQPTAETAPEEDLIVPTEQVIAPTLAEDNSGGLELTAQEEANKGTHTYLIVCHGSEMQCATRPTIQMEMSVVFVEDGVKVNGIFRRKVGQNKYDWENHILTFTMDGMTNVFPDGSSDVYTRQD